jgi:hypothetical protein
MRDKRAKVLQILAGILRAKPEEANFNNPLCETAMIRVGPAAVWQSSITQADKPNSAKTGSVLKVQQKERSW